MAVVNKRKKWERNDNRTKKLKDWKGILEKGELEDKDTCEIYKRRKDCEQWRYEINHSLLNFNGFATLLVKYFILCDLRFSWQ